MTENKALPLPPLEDFFTSEKAGIGIKVPLHKPTGELTAHWLLVRGIDSDEFHAAQMAHAAIVREIAGIQDDAKRAVATLDAVSDLLAVLVKDWSFPEECTHANVRELFRKAPQLREQVDTLTRKRAVFFKRLAENS